MDLSRKTLTIAIPTYNRADYLSKCLTSIAGQIDSDNQKVEIIISDNNSSDNTEAIVREYSKRFANFRYHKNETNIGADLNIAKCFELAIAKYVWVFSDDDILLPNTIMPIIQLLEEEELGVLNLTPIWYTFDIADVVVPDEKFNYKVYSEPLKFLEEVNYWITFITGNIINKSILESSNLIYKFKDTNLIQLGWTLPSIFYAKQNAKVFSYVVLGRAAAEGVNYRFFKVFSANINSIIISLITGNIIPTASRDIINKKLITDFFPQTLVPSRDITANDRAFFILYRTFKGYPEFWQILVPLFVKRYYATPVEGVKKLVRKFVLSVVDKINQVSSNQRSYNSSKKLRAFGIDSQLPIQHDFISPHLITIGRRFHALSNLRIIVYDYGVKEKADAQVIIGDDVRIGFDCHITCSERVIIGNRVLFGNQVFISDSEFDDESTVDKSHRSRRKVISKGEVIIGNNVVIEDRVCIRSGVQIGANSIIKAGAFVSMNVPPNTIVDISLDVILVHK
ncbi:MAG: glycosyltransferase [Hymenobacter sp.]|nr:MAG: glycosyltransferase [Hymenobacter sp.]